MTDLGGAMDGVARIALIRHGRSAHVHSGWIDASGFEAWRAAYEAAGIREDEKVPHHVRQLVDGARLFAASDARRAIESARLLARGRDVLISPLLCELDLPAPGFGNARLPLAGWGLAIALRMFHRSRRGTHLSNAERERVAAAARWLDTLAHAEQFVAVVTHGSFRRELSQTLRAGGWTLETSTSPFRHWSVWLLTKAAEPPTESTR